jgi:uncharacterized protein (TIGR03083 family)
MDTDSHLRHLGLEAHGFADDLAAAAAAGALATRVVTCPDWTVRELAEHVGGIFRWSTHLVTAGVGVETWRSELPIDYPAHDAEVVAWFAASVAPMLDAFAAAPPMAPVWVWGTDPHARFWPRRMLHESVVHRADLAATVGPVRPIDVDLATDGIDEFLTNLPATARWGAPLDRLRGSGETMALRATDAALSWRVRFEPTGWWWDRSDAEADATVAGPVADLYLFLQGRSRPAVAVTGDVAIVDRWRSALDF